MNAKERDALLEQITRMHRDADNAGAATIEIPLALLAQIGRALYRAKSIEDGD